VGPRTGLERWKISPHRDCFRRYVIKIQSAAFYCVQNVFNDVSTECVAFTFRVQPELIGEWKNVSYVA